MAEVVNDIVEDTPVDAASDGGSDTVCSRSDCDCWWCDDKREREARKLGPEAYKNWRREKEERIKREKEEEEREMERRQRVQYPWLWETRNSMAEPPDINHRRIIIDDQEQIDRLLEDEGLHFTERCLRYQEQDNCLEQQILQEYIQWTLYMHQDAKRNGDQARERFFEDLSEVVSEDKDEVLAEWDKLDHEQNERKRQQVAQRLAIPSRYAEWTTEDRQRFYEDDEYVDGWPMDDRQRYQASQKLGIPMNHEEWTTEDRQRFYKDSEFVDGWPTDERGRYRAGQCLSIPMNHEQWTTDDKRRYVDGDVWGTNGWPYKWELQESLEKLDQAESGSGSTFQDTEAQGSRRDSSLPQNGNEDNNQSPHIPNINDEPSSKQHDPASTLPLQEIENLSIETPIKSEIEPLASDSHTSSPLSIELQPQQGTSYYRALATLLLTLLLYELLKRTFQL